MGYKSTEERDAAIETERELERAKAKVEATEASGRHSRGYDQDLKDAEAAYRRAH